MLSVQVNADYKAASSAQDVVERRRLQSQTLSFVFNTYFRVLKHAIELAASRYAFVFRHCFKHKMIGKEAMCQVQCICA